MIKNLITLGDSWVYGDELGNNDHRQKCNWPALVANHFNLKLRNLGFNGESLQSSVWSALWWIENHFDQESMVIAALTQSWRVSWFRSTHAKSEHPWQAHGNLVSPFREPEWHQLKKIHLSVSACDTLDRYNRYQSILFFDGMSRHYQLPLLCFDLYNDQTGFFSNNHVYPGENAEQWVGNNIKPLGHPDENGHILIANKLIHWIESAKLV